LIKSEVDLIAAVTAFVRLQFKKLDSIAKEFFTSFVVNSTLKILNSKASNSVAALSSILESLNLGKVAKERQVKDVLTFYSGSNDDRRVVVTLPDFDSADQHQLESIGYYLQLIVKLLGIKTDSINVLTDTTLGDTVPLTSALKATLDNLLVAATSPTGLSQAKITTTESKLKLSLPSALAYLRSLQKSLPYLHKASKAATNLEITKQLINKELGLTSGSNAWVQSYLKCFMKELVSMTNPHFPASYYKAAKDLNEVKSIEALLRKGGYTPAQVSYSKLKLVFRSVAKFNEAREVIKPISVCTLKDSDDFQISHREFGCAVSLALPAFDPKDLKESIGRLKSDNYLASSKEALTFFNENAKAVAQVDKTYAFLRSLSKAKHKTKPANFFNEKGALAKKFSSLPFMDRNGCIYKRYGDIPLNIREYLEKLFKRKIAKKRSADDAEMGEEEDSDSPPSQKPALKKSRGSSVST
jgi:hypothetical protein